jgi:hypothetical protein
MSSVSRSTAQAIPYFYAPQGALANTEILTFTESATVPGTGGFAPASSGLLSLAVLSATGLLKDMGRTVVSAGRSFRKVAFLSSGVTATEGVMGFDTTYETFYVEMGIPNFTSASAVPTGVVRYY